MLASHEGICVDCQVVEATNLYKVDPRIYLHTTATLLVNSPTAWMMLKDFCCAKARRV